MSVPRDFSRASWRLKFRRAEEHLKELEAEIGRYVNRHPYEARREDKGKPNADARRYVVSITHQPHPEIGLALGDVCHSLRSALDHLANALMPPNRQGLTTFPIMTEDMIRRDDSGAFKNKKARERFDSIVRGMADEAVAIIEELQPCVLEEPATHPLAMLNDLDNTDKHRQFLTTATGLFNAVAFVVGEGNKMLGPGWHRPYAEDGTEIALFDPTLYATLAPDAEVYVYVSGIPKITVKSSLGERDAEVVEMLRWWFQQIPVNIFAALEEFVRD